MEFSEMFSFLTYKHLPLSDEVFVFRR